MITRGEKLRENLSTSGRRILFCITACVDVLRDHTTREYECQIGVYGLKKNKRMPVGVALNYKNDNSSRQGGPVTETTTYAEIFGLVNRFKPVFNRCYNGC